MEDDKQKAPIRKAVALRYRQQLEDAPRVVAKGKNHIAEKIIELAKKHGVHTYQDNQLVGLLMQLELDTEIPPELYQAVALVLAFVFRVQNKMMTGEETHR